jgi:hypothetical protein
VPSIRADKLRDEAPRRSIRGYSGTELWEVWCANDDGTMNTNAAVSPREAMEHAELPKIGTGVGPGGSARVDVGVVKVVGPWSVIVAVMYRGWGLYSGIPRSRSRTWGKGVDEIVPVYTSKNLGGGVLAYWLNDSFKWIRHRTYRSEVRSLPGNQINVVQAAISRSIGGWYQIGTDFFILSGESRADYDGGTFTIAEYLFESWSKFPGVPVGDPVLRNAVAIPAIGNLETWSYSAEPEASSVPVISVVPKDRFASQGLALPGFS